MSAVADLILSNGEVHSLAEPDTVSDAVAIQDGEIIRVGSVSEVHEVEGTETKVIDLDGRVVIPGFIDAHSHLDVTSRYVKYADLRWTTSAEEYLDILRDSDNQTDDGWIIGYDRNTWKKRDMSDDAVVGFDFDERIWDENAQIGLTKSDLDRVSDQQPVVVFRDDMRFALVNSIVLDSFEGQLGDDIQYEDGTPTGVITGDGVDVLHRKIESGTEDVRKLLLEGQAYANSIGVTGVHDFVRRSLTPEVYRKLDLENLLHLRVRLNYWTPHLDELINIGMQTNHGSDFVRMGAAKLAIDGSLGSGTAKLSTPYNDAPADDTDYRGNLRISEEELRDTVHRIDDRDLQIAIHSMGDEATGLVITAYEEQTADPGDARHRIEHMELLTDDYIRRIAENGIVASVQPNFMKWMNNGGLYEGRLGTDRARTANPYTALLDAGIRLAFGSDKMPFGPLFGIHQAVNAPSETQRLSVTEAFRAYTLGGAYAGFDEHRLGSIEKGKRADIAVLNRSPWEHPEDTKDIGVDLTLVDGTIVHDDR